MICDYSYMNLNTKFLSIDPLYQRNLDPTRVSRIVRNFNPCLVNAVKVSFRDGKYWVFDGQHTMQVLKARNGGKDCTIECKVFKGLTELDELDLFLAQTGDSRRVNIQPKLRALYNFGDPIVVRLVGAINRAGLTPDLEGQGQARGRIAAMSTVYRLYRQVPSEDFEEGLYIIKTCWDGSIDSMRAEILNGVILFCAAYRGEYDRKRLVRILTQISPLEIIREGKSSSIGGNKRYARAIVKFYNHGAKNRLPDKF